MVTTSVASALLHMQTALQSGGAHQMPATCSASAPAMKGANSTTWLTSQIHSKERLKKVPTCSASGLVTWLQRCEYMQPLLLLLSWVHSRSNIGAGMPFTAANNAS